MTKRDLFEVGLKLFAVYLIYSVLSSLNVFLYEPPYDVRSGSIETIWLLNASMQLILAVLFIFKSAKIASLIRLSENTSSDKHSVSSIGTKGLLRVGIVLLGIYTFTMGLQLLAMKWPMIDTISELGSFSGQDSTKHIMAMLMGPLVMIFFGIVMVSGARLISDLLIRD